MRTTKAAFTRHHSGYGYGPADAADRQRIDDMREHEFPQLQDVVYLDHAGATLYGNSQLQQCVEELQGSVLGNPHSHSLLHSAASDGSTASRVAVVRRRVLQFFNASEEEYAVVFTSGATAALKMVGECFPWSDKSTFAHSMDSHTSVLGMRSYASHGGASVVNVPLDEMQRLQQQASASLSAVTTEPTHSDSHHLFVFPAECNFSGTRHELSLVSHIQQHGYPARDGDDGKWFVLVDAAKFVAAHQLDLRSHKPDFVALSFYKLFGYPTGIGALLVHRQRALPLLQKRYYGGGTVSNILASSNFVRLKEASSEARLEDGTVSYLSIMSLRHGFDLLEKLTMSAIEKHTASLSALLRSELRSLRHWNGVAACVLYGEDTSSSITSFNFIRADGSFVGYAEVAKLAAIHNIHLRTGCFCNPGACQWYLGLKESDLMESMAAGHVCGDDVDLVNGLPTGAVRVSVGYMSTYEDVAAFISFVTKYFVACVAPPVSSPVRSTEAHKNSSVVLRKLVLFPIKSCAGMSVDAWPVGSRGLLYDREWAILDASTRKALTLKDAPELCFLDPIVDLQQQQLTIQCRKSNDSFSLPLYATVLDNKDEEAQDMRVCAAACKGRDVGDAASEWLSHRLQRACRLVRVSADNVRSATSSQSPSADDTPSSSAKIGFANQAQFLLISRASVANLNASLATAGADMQIREDAFRANLIVDTSDAFAEDAWTRVRIGDVVLDVTGPCGRCSMINIDPHTGAFHRAPLQVLSRYRRTRSQIFFGQFLSTVNGAAHNGAWLRVGSSVDVEVVDHSL